MKNDPLEGCVREKREGEGERAKDSIVGGRKRERERRRKIWRETDRRSDENEDVIGEKSISGEKQSEEGGGAVSKRTSVQVSESCISHN